VSGVIFHLTKTIILGVVMYFSAGLLGFHHEIAFLLSLIPVVLMVLSIFTGFAFRLVAVSFIVACLITALSDKGYDVSHLEASANGLLTDAKGWLRAATR
jgi:hypothetical protein